MGATFAAVHVKGVGAREVSEGVIRALTFNGCTLLKSGERAGREYRVILVEEAGWTTLADDDHVMAPDLGDEWAEAITQFFKTHAIVINVFTSDYAMLSAWSNGKRVGGFDVREDAKHDRKSGHAKVQAKFLAKLTDDGNAKQAFAAGLIADGTFPEDTTTEAAELLGIAYPRTGAPYLWEDAPRRAIRLRFARPAGEEEEEEEDAGDDEEWSAASEDSEPFEEPADPHPPRIPLLPPGFESIRSERERIEAARALDGDNFVQGWIGFDAPWKELRAWILDATSRLGALAAGTEKLEVRVTHAATHPAIRRRFTARDHLVTTKGFANALRFLDEEAIVELGHPYLFDMNPAHATVRHQPHGSTVLGKKDREEFKDDPRGVPVELSFAVPRDDGKAVTRVVEAVMREAARMPGIIGGFAAPVRTVTTENFHDAFDELIDTERFTSVLEIARKRVRAPGWMVFVPGEAAELLDGKTDVVRTRCPAGVLLRSRAESPFTMTHEDRTAMERTILGALSSRDELLGVLLRKQKPSGIGGRGRRRGRA